MAATTNLIIPVYLNQRIVFDLMAVLEGGLASVTQVSQTNTAEASTNQRLGATLGLAEALSSLMRIDVGAKQDRRKNDTNSTTKTEERIHTAVSLFIALRKSLQEQDHLKEIERQSIIKPGDLIEFESPLFRNPLVETFDTFLELFDLANAFTEIPKGKGNQKNEMAQIKKQMASFSATLKAGDTSDLITPKLDSGHRAVISLENRSLNDPSMSDLIDGTFRVVGKVTRVIAANENGISLNRKSIIRRLPQSALEALSAMTTSSQLAEMRLPSIEWEIEGPAIQVLPIAIFA